MLATANGGDDFELVAVLQVDLRILAARNDFAVALHRDAFAAKLHRVQELRQGERGSYLRRSIYSEGNHGVLLLKIQARILSREFCRLFGGRFGKGFWQSVRLGCKLASFHALAGVVQWQNESFPSFRCGFDPHRPLHAFSRGFHA